MNKKLFLHHKNEKERLISKSYILREQINNFKNNLNNNLIKIITGPRRAGKSVFCFELLKNTNFAYLNFDDENLLKIQDYDTILPLLREIYPDFKYIFFDEIQNLPQWELFVNKLQRRGENLIITGSNAKMLAKEMATSLTGRYIATEIFPFSFKEYLIAKNFEFNKENINEPEKKALLLSLLDDYIINGGFPETVLNKIDIRNYLSTLFDAVIFKDVAARYKIRSPKDIYNIAIFMLSNPACELSYKKMTKLIGLKSTATLIKYVSYLEEAYLFQILNRFSFKAKKQINSPKKIFVTDNGYINSYDSNATPNKGRLVENTYFIEMLRRGYKQNRDIFYYRSDSGVEIDFVLKQGTTVEKLVQICLDVNNPVTLEREIKPLVSQSNYLRCENLEIITWDNEGEEKLKGKKVKIIPLWKVFIDNGSM